MAAPRWGRRSAVEFRSLGDDYGLTLSLPSVLGRTGVTHSFVPEMNETERAEFHHCLEQLKAATLRLGWGAQEVR